MSTTENQSRACARICGPCTLDCNQGRACPARAQAFADTVPAQAEREQRLPPGSGVALVIAVGFVVLAAAVAVLV